MIYRIWFTRQTSESCSIDLSFESKIEAEIYAAKLANADVDEIINVCGEPTEDDSWNALELSDVEELTTD